MRLRKYQFSDSRTCGGATGHTHLGRLCAWRAGQHRRYVYLREWRPFERDRGLQLWPSRNHSSIFGTTTRILKSWSSRNRPIAAVPWMCLPSFMQCNLKNKWSVLPDGILSQYVRNLQRPNYTADSGYRNLRLCLSRVASPLAILRYPVAPGLFA